MATAHSPQARALARAWRNFRQWRRVRPFWGGLLQVLAGVELFLSSNMSFGALSVHFGPTGFLSYVIPAILFLCGVLTWVSPAQRLFYGIVGSLVAVYSLIGLNFGGFLLGLLLGMIGGALAVAWSPIQASAQAEANPPAADEPVDDEPAVDGSRDDAPGSLPGEQANQVPRYDHGQPYIAAYTHADATATAEIPREVQDPERWWGGKAEPGTEEPPPHGGGSGGNRGRLLAITLVPVTLAAVALMTINGPRPAYAEPCPVPSASKAAAPAAKSTPSKTPATGNKTQPTKPAPAPAPSNGGPAPDKAASDKAASDKAASDKAAPAATPPPSSAPTGTGNPIIDGWNNFVGGVKRLFGGGNNATPAPAPSGSATPSPSTSGSAAPPAKPGVSGPAAANPPGAGPAQPKPPASASASSVPCLGPGLVRSAVLPPGIPSASVERAVLSGKKLTMWSSTYDGVVDLPLSNGTTVKVLQFTMEKSETTPFQLSVKEKNGKSTVITSDSLITDSTPTVSNPHPRTVKFFTPRFEGKLKLLPTLPDLLAIPVTYTPDSPPPLTLPVLWFIDVKIDLASVQSDELTAKNMLIREV